jgi:hypothetical protein
VPAGPEVGVLVRPELLDRLDVAEGPVLVMVVVVLVVVVHHGARYATTGRTLLQR